MESALTATVTGVLMLIGALIANSRSKAVDECKIDEPVVPQLLGLDYIEAWLAQMLVEMRWIAQFEAESCIAVLERACPDYKGLRVNLHDLLLPHEDELARGLKSQPLVD